jgi:uncharacterized protein (TIRG00374 family)
MDKQKIRKVVINTIKYLAFFIIGIFIFWLVYRNIDTNILIEELKSINYWWILLSFLIGMLSHYSRALRWNMLIKTLGYKPRTLNSFLSVLIMYLTNLALPRAGEIARCSVLTKYEKIPFSKLVGTVVIERITDVIALAIFAFFIILSQIGVITKFLNNYPETKDNLINIFSLRNLLIILSILAIIVLLSFLFRSAFKKTIFYKKIVQIIHNIIEGIKTILNLENKWHYILHTCFIYLMWLLSLYVLFFAFKPTSHLDIFAAMTTFIMGSMGMLAPVQAGIGPYHFMIYETLFIYGINKVDGKIFALISHTSTNLTLMIAGLISLIILPIINNSGKKI